MAPSSSTFAPTQQITVSSRFVAASRNWPPSVCSSTFPSTGRVLLGATTRPTVASPSFSFSGKQVNLMLVCLHSVRALAKLDRGSEPSWHDHHVHIIAPLHVPNS